MPYSQRSQPKFAMQPGKWQCGDHSVRTQLFITKMFRSNSSEWTNKSTRARFQKLMRLPCQFSLWLIWWITTISALSTLPFQTNDHKLHFKDAVFALVFSQRKTAGSSTISYLNNLTIPFLQSSSELLFVYINTKCLNKSVWTQCMWITKPAQHKPKFWL